MGGLIHRVTLLAASIVLLVAGAGAQLGTQSRKTNTDVSVRVAFDNEHAAGRQIRVELISGTGISLAQNFTDAEGRVQFHITEAGPYQVKVDGTSIQNATESFQIYDMDRSRTVFVHVKPKEESTVKSKASDGSASVASAASLRVPSEAQKEFKKGLQAWEQKDYAKAAQHFEKATALYPQYDTAYNNLGVMYMHLGDAEKAHAAFQESVKLNDKNADADRNFARVLLKEDKYAEAQDLLRKSLAVEPLNPIALTLLAVTEMRSGNLDAALEDVKKVHAVPHDGYALSHYLAGQMLERKHQFADATQEYQTYLRESPNGPEAPMVKNALARVTAAANGASDQ